MIFNFHLSIVSSIQLSTLYEKLQYYLLILTLFIIH